MHALSTTPAIEGDFVRALTKLAALPALQTGPIGLAVSGGSDSLALLYLAAATRSQHGRDLLVLTVNHGLRPEAADEAAYVARVAHGMGLPHQTLRWSEPVRRSSAARSARYRLLSQALISDGGTLLLTGHTSNDVAETAYMRARAGSGPYGLAGIQPLAVNPSFVWGAQTVIGRPLLKQSRSSLRAFLGEQSVVWIDDPSNDNPESERIQARHALAASPALAAQIEAEAAQCSADRRPVDRALAVWLRSEVVETSAGFAFAALPGSPDTAARGLVWLIQLLTRQTRFVRRDALERLIGRLMAPDTFTGATLGHVQFRAKDGAIDLTREKGAPSPPGKLNARRRFLSDVLEANAVTLL